MFAPRMTSRAARSGLSLLAVSLALLGSSACDGRAAAPAAETAEPEDAAEEPVQQGERAPALTFERTTLQLGPISDAVELRASFPFTNTGSEELVITEVRTTCGCTTTQLARDRYAPGEGAEIEVVYRPQGEGHQRRTVSVLSNDPSGQPVDLNLEGTVEPFLRFEPRSGVMLGEVDRGREHRARVRFSCADPDATVVEVSTMNPELEAHLLEKTDDGWQEVELVLSPDAGWGNFTSRLVVKVEGRPTEDSKVMLHMGRMLFNAMVLDQVRVEPSFFSVGLVEPGADFRGQVDVVHRHGGDFGLRGVHIEDATPAAMTARFEPIAAPIGPAAASGPSAASAPRRGQRVIIEGEAGAAEGHITGVVVIQTDIPDEPEFRLPISGRIGQRPQRHQGQAHHGHSH